MTGFSMDWLSLREPADLDARNTELLDLALDFAMTANESACSCCVDLGAGTGSTLRALANRRPACKEALSWRLVDNDENLLQAAMRYHGQQCQLEIYCQDLGQLAALPLTEVKLVTASALFDLVSASFIDGLAAGIGEQPGAGLYSALNYDGTLSWSPEHPLDQAVVEVINLDQKKNKGFGPALGPDAVSYTEKVFTEHQFEVRTASSPWILGSAYSELAAELVRGIGRTVSEYSQVDSQQLNEWVNFRLAHVVDGECRVGHLDLLAVPAEKF
ncbi:MAG: class I SAM-dependent methyltransferase [Gammaproteobacteria bacterium]